MIKSTETQSQDPLTKKDFESDQDTRWCPGCGDYAILAQTQKAFAELGLRKENTVVVSGIGCAARFPYYLDTYGFHTIHGRALPFATGIKVINPDLSVWVATGDGDALSIGGNHLIHAIRRNLDVNILLFNNRIYGLTKGQYSPTSEQGKITKSTPEGSLEHPINPIDLALGAGATFVARTMDRDLGHMQEVLQRAYHHKGTSFIEILQNCHIFNDGTWNRFSEKSTRADNTIYVQDGEPLLFGEDKTKGIILEGQEPKVVTLTGSTAAEQNVIVHNEKATSSMSALMLSEMISNPDLPAPMGVFRAVQATCFEETLNTQIKETTEKRGKGDLQSLLKAGDTWVVGD